MKDLRESVAQDNRAMEGRIMMRLADMEAQTAKRLDDHDDRIRELEIDKGKQAGRAGVVGTFIGALLLGVLTWLRDAVMGGKS